MKKIEELKAAYAAGTNGTWNTEQSSRTDIYILSDSIVAKNKWVATACNHEMHPTEAENERNKANAQFIALAHNLMPSLLELIDKYEMLTAVLYTHGVDHPVTHEAEDMLRESLENLK